LRRVAQPEPVDIPVSFNGREYRLTIHETNELAAALDERAQWPRQSGVPFRHHEDDFASVAARLRDAAEPPVSAVELQAHEAAAVVIVFAGLASAELQRFYRDYAAENLWPHQPFSYVLAQTIEACFALRMGQWFFDEALRFPIGGLDEETGEDLPPRESDFAAHAAANVAFAETASMWARLRGSSLGDERVVADDTLAWLRSERERASSAAEAATDAIEQAEAGSRAWALREAGLWLESCANRARRPWEAPRHEA
jgi:hypothetical protein